MPDEDERELIVPARQHSPELCSSCDKPINPYTGECAGCSD